jgi:hypothetical protein
VFSCQTAKSSVISPGVLLVLSAISYQSISKCKPFVPHSARELNYWSCHRTAIHTHGERNCFYQTCKFPTLSVFVSLFLYGFFVKILVTNCRFFKLHYAWPKYITLAPFKYAWIYYYFSGVRRFALHSSCASQTRFVNGMDTEIFMALLVVVFPHSVKASLISRHLFSFSWRHINCDEISVFVTE